MKKILVPNASICEENIIRIYKDMGLYVITSGNAPHFKGHKLADKYVNHDYSDLKGMLQIAEEEGIDYISACANDFGVLTAAYIAEEMGLPGHDAYQTARIIAEKDLFKSFSMENKLQVIPSIGFEKEADAIDYAHSMTFPIMVKPVDLTGGKGVTKVGNKEEAKIAIHYAFERSKAKRIVLEPFIQGSQHSLSTFLINKKVVRYGSFNEFDANDPFLVGSTTSPADNEEETKDVLFRQIEKMAELLDLKDGIFHIQYRMDGDKPLIMECMRRILGNHALEYLTDATGINWEYWIARSYCGMDIMGILREEQHCIEGSEVYIQARRNGIIKDVRIDSALRPYIFREIMDWYPGQILDDYKTEKLGYLFMKFGNRQERDIFYRNIDSLVTIEME